MIFGSVGRRNPSRLSGFLTLGGPYENVISVEQDRTSECPRTLTGRASCLAVGEEGGGFDSVQWMGVSRSMALKEALTEAITMTGPIVV